MTKCQKCTKHATFNYISETKPLFCKEHKIENMINVKDKRCCNENCLTRPTFNYIGETKALFCKEHKKENMIDVKNKHCCYENCSTRPNFNYIGETKALFCKKHKKDDMIDVEHKYCCYKNCLTRPTFNYIGETKALFCKEHKKVNMIDITSERCCYENCLTCPVFNYIGEPKALFCKEHKKENMINVKDRHCCHENCLTSPAFNYIDEPKPLFCKKHKKENMINIKSKRCCYENCFTQPAFNYIGEKNGIFCEKHRKENMINIKKKILTCIHKKCNNIPLFNFENKKAIYCNKHKKENMINIQIKLKCCECNNLPILSLDDKYYCSKHYPNKNLIDETKKLCSIHDTADTTYVCNECKTKSNHPKEYKVVYHVKKNINKKCMTDSNLPVSECSKRRPDIYYECNKHVVIIEVDEHQHRNYIEECECKRINEIVSSIGGKSVIFIRYNPDKIMNKKKEIKIPNTNRLDKLIEVIKYELNNDYDKITVKLIQLFYNDDNKIYESYKEEDITNKVMI